MGISLEDDYITGSSDTVTAAPWSFPSWKNQIGIMKILWCLDCTIITKFFTATDVTVIETQLSDACVHQSLITKWLKTNNNAKTYTHWMISLWSLKNEDGFDLKLSIITADLIKHYLYSWNQLHLIHHLIRNDVGETF